jgi:uncharacterized membrane protein YphA (DoxX/SURF4 family)
MANVPKGKPSGGAYTIGLRVLAFALGLFFIFNAIDKAAWIADSGILEERLRGWLERAPPRTRWYIETVAMPGVPLFARLVPGAELSAGAALILGFWTRLAAAVAFLMVANFHVARGFIDSAGASRRWRASARVDRRRRRGLLSRHRSGGACG